MLELARGQHEISIECELRWKTFSEMALDHIIGMQGNKPSLFYDDKCRDVMSLLENDWDRYVSIENQLTYKQCYIPMA